MSKSTLSRRDFMQTGAVLAGGTALAGSASPAAAAPAFQPTTGKIKFGCIGVGQKARGHLRMMETFSDMCEITAVCDIEQAQIDESLGLLNKNKPKVYYDWKEMIQHPGLNALLIATPHYLHREMAITCLDNKFHILLEKPMAMNPAECADIIKAWRYSGKTLLIGHQSRYSPSVKAIKKIIDDGELGEIKFIWSNRFRRDWARKGKDPNMEDNLNWMYMKTLQGDSLVADTSHEYDMCNYFTNSRPQTAMAIGGVHVYTEGRNTFDHCATIVEFETGAKLSLSMLLYSRGNSSRIIVGDKAQLVSRSGDLVIQPREREVPEKIVSVAKDDNSRHGDGANSGMYRDFFECVKTGRLPVSNALSAKDAILAAYACQLSVYTEEVIRVKDLDV